MVCVSIFILPVNKMLAKFANQHFTSDLEVTGECHGSVLWGGGLSCGWVSSGVKTAVCPAYTVLRRGGGVKQHKGCSVQVVSVQFSTRCTLLFHNKMVRQSNHFKIHIKNRFFLYWPINQENCGAYTWLEIPQRQFLFNFEPHQGS